MSDEIDLARYCVELPAPEVPKRIALSAQQQAGLDQIRSNPKRNFFLTGEAGTGKSVLVHELAALEEVALCATTGLAALNIGGTTIDRLFNMSRETWTARTRKTLIRNMENIADTVICDEWSMAGYCMNNYIADCLEEFGKRIIMVGDLAQAAPVEDLWCVDSKLFRGADHIKLTEVFRQRDMEFVTALLSIRRGSPDAAATALMESCVGKPDDNAVHLFAINKSVDKYNNFKLSQVNSPGPDVQCRVFFKDLREEFLRTSFPVKPGQIRDHIENSKLADGDVIRIGARVMMTKNGRDDAWVNGDCGVLLDMRDEKGVSVADSPYFKISSDQVSDLLIQLDRSSEPLLVTRVAVTSQDAAGKPVFGAYGFPVRLGYAYTTHRCQGMSLDNVYIDMDSIAHMKTRNSMHGLAYVAISRARTRQGLRLSSWRPDLVHCDPQVLPHL